MSLKGVFYMEHYDKKGKNQRRHFPEDQRQIWNSTGPQNIKSDVLGSYSGTEDDDNEPVQDADDL